MVHGMQHRIANPSARTDRVMELQSLVCESAFQPERYAAHPRTKGSSEPSEGLVISAKPHSNPYPHHSRTRRDSATSSVAHSSVAARSAAREVSQIHSNGIITALGNSAHIQAAPVATPMPATRFAT